MVGRHQDMERWGVISIFKEAGKLLYQHFRILRPFILAFLLPLALILFLQLIGLAWLLTWIADNLQPHLVGDVMISHHLHFGFHAFQAIFFKAPNSPDPFPIFVLEFLLLIYTLNFLIFTISWLLESLSTAATAKAIHHIYSSNNTSHNEEGNSSQTLTLTQSIFTSLPHSLYRIFIISLCFFVIDIFTYFFLTLPFYLLSGPKFYPYHLQTLHVWLWYLVFLILDFWFKVSVQVTVLENHYGWAVLQRSAKLVKAKVATALGLCGIYFVYFCLFNWVLVVAIMIPTHSVMLYVLAGAIMLGNLVFGVFWLVVVTVFYFVSECKCGGGNEGHHGEGDQYQALDASVEN